MGYPETAQRLGVSVSTLERLVRAGKVSRVKVGGRACFTEAFLLEYLEECEKEAKNEATNTKR